MKLVLNCSDSVVTCTLSAGSAGGRAGAARVHLRAARGPRRAAVHQGVAAQVPHLHARLRLRPLPAPPQDHPDLRRQYLTTLLQCKCTQPIDKLIGVLLHCINSVGISHEMYFFIAASRSFS